MSQDKPKRLVIEFDEWDAVPQIYIDGEQIKYICDLSCSWLTKSSDDIDGKFKFRIKHYEKGLYKTKEIERATSV